MTERDNKPLSPARAAAEVAFGKLSAAPDLETKDAAYPSDATHAKIAKLKALREARDKAVADRGEAARDKRRSRAKF
jgi:hypothetical protein